MGKLGVLNVSGGDIEIRFDNQNTAECIRAKRMITDMLRRGYALLVEGENGTYTRCLEFKEETGVYVVADFDPEIAKEVDANDSAEKNQENGQADTGKSQDVQPALKTRGRKSRKKEIPMEQATVRAVARTSGG